MDQHQHHQEIINGLHEELKMIFEGSEQAIYAYLDDDHRVCNQKFAAMLGYASPEEWHDVKDPLPGAFVAEKSQEMVIEKYRDAMEKMVASTFKVTMKKKSGETSEATVIMVPMVYQDHLYALHFVS